MHRLRPLLLGVAVVYLLTIAIGAFLLREPLPIWAALLVWFVAGLLLGAAVRPSRWWVALGFLWLGTAWVEAGQMVWLERQGSAVDVVLGCLASAAGVGVAVACYALRDRSAARAVSGPAGAPPRR